LNPLYKKYIINETIHERINIYVPIRMPDYGNQFETYYQFSGA
jgi:hypothetical protein